MNLSQEGLRARALSLISLVGTKSRGLPRALTPDVTALGNKIYREIVPDLYKQPFLKQCIRDVLAHNKTKPNKIEHLGLFVVVFPNQSLDDDAVLRAQTMCIPAKGLGTERLPPVSAPMEAADSVHVRVEIYLTQEGDTKSWDFSALDEDVRVFRENDADSLQRRLTKQMGIPKEVLQQVQQLTETHPDAFTEWVRTHADPESVRLANNAVLNMMRSCCVCKKYGMSLSKCSACKSVYYCSAECQKKDWGTHKESCGLVKKKTAAVNN
jgi:hypothetical protein